MRHMEVEAHTLEELEVEAARFAAALLPHLNHATVVLLSGDLGAGKTAFTKAVAKALGIDEVVNSPTFVLEKIYVLSRGPFKRLVHIDAYRLEQGSDLAPLGFDELMQNAQNLILLEWPEKVSDALLAPAAKVSLVANADGSRTISYD